LLLWKVNYGDVGSLPREKHSNGASDTRTVNVSVILTFGSITLTLHR
jgi:hypothetical protein